MSVITLQTISLSDIAPNENNVRLYYDMESLEELRTIYRAYAAGEDVVLPDAPVVRPTGGEIPYELLRGHRRLMAAVWEGVEALPCRVEEMDDEEAFLYITDADKFEEYTTIELAYHAFRMDQLGFSPEQIQSAIFGHRSVQLSRYLAVGAHVDVKRFTDVPKLCDPSIIVWFEAMQYGPDHFQDCFYHWDRGLWDDRTCQKEFRRRGKVLPIDNNEKGLRLAVSADGRVLKLRGTIDLDMYTDLELHEVVAQFIADLRLVSRTGVRNREEGGFGDSSGRRQVRLYNPDTLGDLS